MLAITRFRVSVLTRCLLVGLQAATRASADPPTVDAILDRVEARGAAVDDIRCAVVFTEDDRITEDVTRKEGVILFKRKLPNPNFLVAFEKIVQNGRISRSTIWYRFDGRYLSEAYERSQSVIRRDLAPPGSEIDLFSMEKAPFPIPFGQKKAEILGHFDVQIGPGADGAPPDTDHLVCAPKPGSRFAKDYTVVEFYVSRSLDLPIRIVMTTNPPDKTLTADFPDLSAGSINAGMPDDRLDLPAETRKYAVSEE